MDLDQQPIMKQGAPLLAISVFNFLSQHYSPLSSKLEEYLASERDQYEAQIKELERRSAKEDQNSWAISTLYPNTVRYSMFITLYQQLEFAMNEACSELEKDYPNSVKLSELNHKGLRRAYTYLQKVAGIREPFETSSWSKINDLNTLRNIIVHNDAMVTSDKRGHIKQTVERINHWAPVTLKESRILLSNNFIERTCSFLSEQADYLGRQLVSAGWRR